MSDAQQEEKQFSLEIGTSEMAAVLGLGVRRLQQLTKEGAIPKLKHGKYELTAAVPAYLQWKIAQCEVTEDDELDLRKERTLLTRVQRQKAEVELAIMQGELHRSEDVERVMNGMITAFRARALAVPNRSAPMVNGKSIDETRKLLKAEIHDALQEMSEYDPGSFYQPPDSEIGDG